MKALVVFLALAATLGATPVPSGGTWSWVSAADPARAVDAVVVDPSPDEAFVRLIPRSSANAAVETPPRRVVSVELPVTEAEPVAPLPAEAALSEAIPPEARWPDRQGTIAELRPGDGARPRNPWEARTKGKAKGRTAVFLFGGYIGGGPGGPVALVNGRGWRKGQELDGFTVARIGPGGVVLARGSALYVLPPRRQIQIELANP